VPEIESGLFTFSFTRARQSIGAGLAIAIELGTDLATWPDVYPVPDVSTDGQNFRVLKDSPPGSDHVTFRMSLNEASIRFARLKVTVIP
jgi:hypothetical protein